MSSGFDSQMLHVMWVEFVVGSHPCSSLLQGYSGFPSSTKTKIPKLQFNLETVDERATERKPLKFIHSLVHFILYLFTQQVNVKNWNASM